MTPISTNCCSIASNLLKTLLLAVPVMLIGPASPSAQQSYQEPLYEQPQRTLDEKLVAINDLVPGFGGLYIDGVGRLHAFLTDTGDVAPSEVGERTAALTNAMSLVFGFESLRTFLDIQLELAADAGQVSRPAGINFERGEFEIRDLFSWRPVIDTTLAVSGVVFTDLDESRNRLVVGILPGTNIPAIERIISEIPRAAVIIEETQAIHDLNLRGSFRPPQGGVQIEGDKGVFSYSLCTLGFNAVRRGVVGFITNSHCTDSKGGADGMDFHQPDDPWLSSGTKIGDEAVDPEWWTGGRCPEGRRCRMSDSAFIDYSIHSFGSNISVTDGYNVNSLDVSGYLPIETEMSDFLVGSSLNKVGRTTGWTRGHVSATCILTTNGGDDTALICQNRVSRDDLDTHFMADHGDSGSPVFIWIFGEERAALAGILWGSNEENSSFVYSPIANIEMDLGALGTSSAEIGEPATYQLCWNAQRCCYQLGSSTSLFSACGACVPEGAACPPI